MESLENLCLKNVCLNLSLNYLVCKKYKLKIPYKLGQKIFDNSFNYINKFNKNDLKLFSNNFIQLINVDLYKKQFKNIKYFDFLNGHQLDKLIIGNIDNFQLLTNNNFSISTKQLIIGKKNGGITNNLNNFKILLMNCKITESIIFHFDEDIFYSNLIYHLLKNAGNSLKIIDLRDLRISVNQLIKLKPCLNRQKSIVELYLNFMDKDKFNGGGGGGRITEEINDEYIENFIYSIPNTIVELNIYILPEQNYISKYLPDILRNLNNLKVLFIEEMPLEENITFGILDCLKNYHCHRLTDIELIFMNINEYVNDGLVELLKKCSKLKYLHITCQSNEINCLNHEIIQSINANLNKIEEFYINFKDSFIINETLKRYLNYFSSLTSLDLGYFIVRGIGSNDISKLLNSLTNCLEHLKIFDCVITENFAQFLSIPEFNNLIKIEINNVDFSGSAIIYLLLRLKINVKNIKCFKMINCDLHEIDALTISNFLQYCQNIEKVNFTYNTRLRNGIIKIIRSLFNSSNTLQSINFSDCGITDYEGQFLQKSLKIFTNLKVLKLKNNLISFHYLFILLNELKISKNFFKEFNIENCQLTFKEYKKLKELSNSFIGLECFVNGTLPTIENNGNFLQTLNSLITSIKTIIINIFDFILYF